MEFLGWLAFGCFAISIAQSDIIKLRLWGCFAGFILCIQFAFSADIPLINVIGQGGLVFYGMVQAHKEAKIKKEKA